MHVYRFALSNMGFGKGSSTEMIKRAFRTMLFMVIMVVSLLVSCAPLLISIVDVLVPCILLSAFACCTSCFDGIYGDWTTYNVRTSIVDIPLLSLIRSLAIFCVYSVCGVPSLTYGPYFSATAICGVVSAFVLILKTCIFFHHDIGILHVKHASADALHTRQAGVIVSLFSCSMALALGHIMVAYKVKCQAQRKMHLHRLDPEAVYGLNAFLYHTYKARDTMGS